MILIDANNSAQLQDVAALDSTVRGVAGWVCYLWNADNASLVGGPAPQPFAAGCWQWDAEAETWQMIAVPGGYAEWAADRIDAQRDARIAGGMPYAFPDGAGTVQLRNERDIRNVSGVGTSGLMLAVAGDTTTKLEFRDMEDVTHFMTGAEAQSFGLAVAAWISAHYARAWALKDAIAAAVTAGDCAALTALDFDAGWPDSTKDNAAGNDEAAKTE